MLKINQSSTICPHESNKSRFLSSVEGRSLSVEGRKNSGGSYKSRVVFLNYF